MARKKIEPIINLGNKDKLTVQKSLPLFALWRSELTLAEFKILDTYLSRINSHNPDKRTVVFEKGELEKLLGVKRIRVEELDERLKHLGTPIKFEDSLSKNKRFTRVSLFEKAYAEQDDNKLWKVELTASQSAMKYFFNIENLGYLRYKLRCITSLTSRYTYIMFIYIEANRFRKSWEVSLDELREILACNKEETYKAFKRFNDLILKKTYKELHEKTECRYTYEPIKKGRNVVKIRFEVETLALTQMPDEEQIPGQINIAEFILGQELWETAMPNANFSELQLEQLRAILQSVPPAKLPNFDDIDIARYHYIRQKYTAMIAYDEKKPIKNQFSYLCKMIEKDI